MPAWLLAKWGEEDLEAGPFMAWDARAGRARESDVYVRMPEWRGRRVHALPIMYRGISLIRNSPPPLGTQ